MNKTIVFYCSHQHGDLMQTRQGARYIMNQLGSSYKYYFIHGKNLDSIFVADNVEILTPPCDFHGRTMEAVKNFFIESFYPFLKDAIWLDIWVGSIRGAFNYTLPEGGSRVLLPVSNGRYSLQHSEEIKFSNYWHVRMYQERIAELNDQLSLSFSTVQVKPPTTTDLIVKWNSNPKNKALVDDLLNKNKDFDLTVLICNGPTQSQQNTNFIYEDILRDFISEHKNICFYLTSKLSEIKSENVFYVDDYFPLSNLSEIEYLTKFCNVIVHSYSGPAHCSLTDEVLNSSDKTVISFCYFSFPPYYEDYKYKFVQTEDFSDENVLNVISSNILEKLN